MPIKGQVRERIKAYEERGSVMNKKLLKFKKYKLCKHVIGKHSRLFFRFTLSDTIICMTQL